MSKRRRVNDGVNAKIYGRFGDADDNQYAHGQITPVLAVITGGTMLSIPAFNWLNAPFSERLMMKDDMGSSV